MKHLVPEYILEQNRKSKYSGDLKGFVIFADISGFTQMTHSLMQNGKEGAEILTQIINRVFTPSINSIYQNNGFISTFAGDAYTAVFQSLNVEGVLLAAFEISNYFIEKGMVKTKFGDFDLAVKIGIAFGNVKWGIIRSKAQNVYYFRGEAVNAAADCEHKCEQNQIVINSSILDKCKDTIEYLKLSSNFFQLKKTKNQPSEIVIKRDISKFPDLEHFFPHNIYSLKIKGEFRDIISCFISFKENAEFSRSISKLIDLANAYKGYFNKIDFGDKGGVALVLFGAPLGLENMEMRACKFALAAREIMPTSIRFGITYGTTFAGFVGSDRRCEYTALGMVVNLSARFMMKAAWGEVYIDKYIYENVKNSYNIDSLSEMEFKGFPTKIPVFKLINRSEQKEEGLFKGTILGREKELKELQNALKPIRQNKFGGIVYLDGKIGVGKSRLIDEFHKELEAINWVFLPCDEILKESFNPFINFFQNYFNYSENNDDQHNKIEFNKKYEELLNVTKDVGIKKELKRTISFIGSLLNLFWKDSLYEQLDAKGRYENIIYSIKNTIKAMSLQKPTIIAIDGTQWIDNDSIKILHALVNNIKNFPIIIIAACRYLDDGTTFSFPLGKIQSKRVIIPNLDKDITQEMILNLLSQKHLKINVTKIPLQTFNLIWDKSSGNPFYIEQIVSYLVEENLLTKELKLADEKIKIPSKINSVIISRIDKLSNIVKDTIKTASVLGKVFQLNLLSQVLQKESIDFQSSQMTELISDAEDKNIWIALKELKYMFSHALIRESIYEIQLKERLRFLHNLAGETIEEVYHSKIEEHYTDLALHFEKAEISDKALLYLSKAGEKAKYNFQNQRALDFFNRKLKIIEKEIDINSLSKISDESRKYILEYIDTLFQIKYFLKELGNMKEASGMVEKALQLSEKINDAERIGKSKLDKGNLLKLKGNLPEAMTLLKDALQIFEKIDDQQMCGLVNLDLGVVSFWTGDQKKAFEYFEKELEIFHAIKDERKYADALGNLGVVHRYLGNYDKAMKAFLEQLELAQKLKDKLQTARVYGNIGWVYEAEEEFEKSMNYYNKALKINLELGQKDEINRIYDNIGIVFQFQKKYDLALKSHFKALKFATEIDQKSAIVNIIVNIANAYKYNKDFKKALNYYDNGIRLTKEYSIDSSLPEFLIEKAELLFEIEDFIQAKKLIDEGLETSKKMNNQEMIEKGTKLMELYKTRKSSV